MLRPAWLCGAGGVLPAGWALKGAFKNLLLFREFLQMFVIKDLSSGGVRVAQRWVLAPAAARLPGLSLSAQAQGLGRAERVWGQTGPRGESPPVPLAAGCRARHCCSRCPSSQQACFSRAWLQALSTGLTPVVGWGLC